jgi:hypothetical protein
MVTDTNPLDSIVTILNADYTTSNTDNITPIIAKIYDYPKIQDLARDYILVYSKVSNSQAVGLGSSPIANFFETLSIDIRVYGDSDTHARKVLTEVRRVLYNKIKNPDSNYDLLSPDITTTDLSDKTRKIYRYVLDITLSDYCRSFS